MSAPQSFWSRRRAAVAAEARAEQAALEAEVHAEEQAVLEEKTDAELLEELQLPDPDTLGAGDDFSVFMTKLVPDRIRRRALRKLWLTNPVLANVDELVDYGEDFTDGAMAVENLQTAYQVGKGMLKHVQEMARQAAEDEAEDDLVAAGVTEEVAPEAEVALAAEPDVVAETDVAAEVDDDAENPEPPVQAGPRRMKFRPEESAA